MHRNDFNLLILFNMVDLLSTDEIEELLVLDEQLNNALYAYRQYNDMDGCVKPDFLQSIIPGIKNHLLTLISTDTLNSLKYRYNREKNNALAANSNNMEDPDVVLLTAQIKEIENIIIARNKVDATPVNS